MNEETHLLRYTISQQLTLAGQPQPEDWARLYDEGFRVIINIRGDAERAAAQQRAAEAAGLRYMYLPLPVYELEAEHLALFHTALAHQSEPVFLHCRTATRVALLWMLDQIVYAGHERAAVEAALRAAGYGEQSMETFAFCADDFFERAGFVAQQS